MNRMLELLAITDQFIQSLPDGIRVSAFDHSDGGDFCIQLQCKDTTDKTALQILRSIAPRIDTNNGFERDTFHHYREASIENGETTARVIISAMEQYDGLVFYGTLKYEQTRITPVGTQIFAYGVRCFRPVKPNVCYEFRVHPDYLNVFRQWAHDQEIVLVTPQDLPNTPD